MTEELGTTTEATTLPPQELQNPQGAKQSGKKQSPKKIQQKPISKKRKFIKDGVFYAEIHDLFRRQLSVFGYGGCEVRVTPTRTEIIIRATKINEIVGQNGRKIRELTSLIQKRFNFPKKGVILFADRIRNQGLSALAQAEAVKYRLESGLSVRRAAYSVLKFIKDKGASGCEIRISGKIRGQRAKSMKFRDGEGYMIHAGDAVNYYIDQAVKHVELRQGIIGIRVKIMLPYDETGKDGGVTRDLPDKVRVKEPKEIDIDPNVDAGNQEQLQRGLQQDLTYQQQQQPQQNQEQQQSNFTDIQQNPINQSLNDQSANNADQAAFNQEFPEQFQNTEQNDYDQQFDNQFQTN